MTDFKFNKYTSLVVLALYGVFQTFTVVSTGNRGVVSTFGNVSQESLSEGLHVTIPFAQKVIEYNVQIQKTVIESDAASKDLQSISTRVALNYHLKAETVSSVYKNIGLIKSVETTIIDPVINESFKAVVAQYTAEEFIVKREKVRENIKNLLSSRLVPYGILIDEVSIVNFRFSKSFDEAIEAKTTAEQLKLKAERDLERIKVEAQQKVAQAEAEAKSLSLQKQEITPELIQLRITENERRAIEKWDGKLPQYTGQTSLPFLKSIK